jgi:hypothetical protein
MPCKKCDNYRQMLQIARTERDYYKHKIDAANKALFFAQALINELEAKRKDPDVLKTCISKLKILIPQTEEPTGIKFERKEKIGGV